MKNFGTLATVICVLIITIFSSYALELPDMRAKIKIRNPQDIYTIRSMRIDADYPDSAAFHAERVVASYSNPKDDKRREACGALVNDPS